MAYKFIPPNEEKGWAKKSGDKGITFESVRKKVCDYTHNILVKKPVNRSGRIVPLDHVLRVGENPNTYNLRLYYGVKHLYTVIITLEGDAAKEGIKAAVKEAKDAVKAIRTAPLDMGLRAALQKAFDERVAANDKAKKNTGAKPVAATTTPSPAVAVAPAKVVPPPLPAKKSGFMIGMKGKVGRR